MTKLRSVGRLLGMSALAGVFAAAIMTGVERLRANIGVPPQGNAGFALVDNQWLLGLAAGTNYTFQSGLTATGTTQATALQLPTGIYGFEIDTVAASTGVALPACLPGTELSIYNNGLQTLTVYPSINNNTAVSPSAQDTINNGTSFSGGIATHVIVWFNCSKVGVWAAK